MLATNLTVLLFFRPSARGNRTGRKVYQWDPNNRSLSLIILQKEKNVHPSQWIWFYRSFVTEWSRSAVNVDWRFRGCFLFIFAYTRVFVIPSKMFDHDQSNELIPILLNSGNAYARYKSTRHAPKRPCIRERASERKRADNEGARLCERAHTHYSCSIHTHTEMPRFARNT